MTLMDRQYLKTPFYGSRRMSVWLRREGYLVNRKRVRRLMRVMGIEAIYRRSFAPKVPCFAKSPFDKLRANGFSYLRSW